MKKKTIFIKYCLKLFLLCFLFNQVIRSEIKKVDYPVDFPVYHPNSPSVSQFNLYGDYPVDYSKGLIDISVPIYEIKTRKLSVPISMSFHASGRRVSDQAGICGLGWTLNAGGVITRKLKNMPDERTRLFTKDKDATEIFESGDYDIKQMAYPFLGGLEYVWETQLDIFNYSLPSGKSGYFVFRQDEEGVKSVLTVPYSSVKISYEYYTGSNSDFDNNICDRESYINSFTIVDTDGTKYTFEHKQVSKIGLQLASDVTYDRERKIITAWYLTKIEPYDSSEEINFSYIKEKEVLLPFSETAALIYNGVAYSYVEYFSPMWGASETTDSLISYTSIIKSISFDLGSLVFNYAKSDGSRHNRLQSIFLNEYETTRIDSFIQEYNDDQELYQLRSFIINASSDNPMVYSFGYYNTCSWTGHESSRDWWGFYNGQSNYSSNCMHIIPFIDEHTRDFGFSSVSREPDTAAMMLGMIKTIRYPTGGYSEFFYEGNRYGKKLGGGLRIYQIASHDNNGNVKYKTYEYYGGNMLDFYQPGASLYSKKTMYGIAEALGGYNLADSHATLIYQGDIPSNLMDFSSYFVDYSGVFEYSGTPEDNEGYTAYGYGEQFEDDFYFYFYGDWEISTNNFEDSEGVYGYFLSNPQPWRGNKLRRKTIYTENGEIEDHLYNYTSFYYDTIYSLNVCCPVSISVGDLELNNIEYDGLYLNSFYDYNSNKLISGVELLSQEIVAKDGVTDTINFEYNKKNMLEKSRTFKNSNEKKITMTRTYPSDYTSDPYPEMMEKNILEFVVERKTFVDDQQMHYMKTVYDLWTNSLFLPVSMYYQNNGQSTAEERIKYYNYDAYGNPQYFAKDSVEKVCYLWGYGFRYPVARIEGLTFDQVCSLYSEASISSLSAATGNSVVTLLTELRNDLSAQNVLLTTYTYLPFAGVLTMTDPRGLTTTYEYDNLNRLKCIKDHDGNIVQQYDYHYAE